MQVQIGSCTDSGQAAGIDGSTSTSYVPTCAGNCYQYNWFNALTLVNGFPSLDEVDCIVYTDDSCNDEFATATGSTGGGICYSWENVVLQSMRCFYGC